jgi:hypothetical protein
VKPLIIGLTGPIGSGKDTAAHMLQALGGYRPIAFADQLREEVAFAFGVPVSLLTDRTTKELPTDALALHRCRDFDFEARMILVSQRSGERCLDMVSPRSPRQILQWWGTEFRRAQSPTYWTDVVKLTMGGLYRSHGVVRFVVTDVRFPNEVQMLREIGGEIWQLRRPGARTLSNHASETTGDQFAPERVLDNDRDLAHLQRLIADALQGADLQTA